MTSKTNFCHGSNDLVDEVTLLCMQWQMCVWWRNPYFWKCNFLDVCLEFVL